MDLFAHAIHQNGEVVRTYEYLVDGVERFELVNKMLRMAFSFLALFDLLMGALHDRMDAVVSGIHDHTAPASTIEKYATQIWSGWAGTLGGGAGLVLPPTPARI